MAKMTKKELKAKDEIEVLEQRMTDMLLGANGPCGPPSSAEEDGDLLMQLGLDVWCRWIAALKREWGWDPNEENGPAPAGFVDDLFFEPEELHNYDTVRGAAEHLHALGARA